MQRELYGALLHYYRVSMTEVEERSTVALNASTLGE